MLVVTVNFHFQSISFMLSELDGLLCTDHR